MKSKQLIKDLSSKGSYQCQKWKIVIQTFTTLYAIIQRQEINGLLLSLYLMCFGVTDNKFRDFQKTA